MKTRLFGVVLVTVISASVANAGPFLPFIPPFPPPPGPTLSDLAPGSAYHLVFLTAGARNALSTDIADYDAFVTAEANLSPELAALGTTWRAIGSTETVDAIDHVGVIGPVFNPVGQQVSAGLSDMFDAGVNAPIVYDQHGAFHPGSEYVWTGTNAFTGRPPSLGQQYLGGPTLTLPPTCIIQPSGLEFCFPNYQGPTVGVANVDERFTPDWLSQTNVHSAATPLHLYGISGALVVPVPETDPPTSVPEPGTLGLMLGPLALLCTRHRQSRRD
jgi:hypothetical protein